MENKERAYQLHLDGKSYQAIGNELCISKTTAHAYVKEIKLLLQSGHPVPVHQDLNQDALVIKEQSTYEKALKLQGNEKQKKQKIEPPNFTKPRFLEFSGDELLKKKFDILEFTGKFLELIGKPEKNFSGIIWGLPKGGKSNLAIRLADYLDEYFGNVIYIAVEEGASQTLKEKIEAIGGSKVTFVATNDLEIIKEYSNNPKYKFVFIDSINKANISNEILESIKAENPEKSFISIVQATKGGNFKGDQALTHNCDFIICVIKGVAYHAGRFGPNSEIDIFGEPLYSKNPDRILRSDATGVEEKKTNNTFLPDNWSFNTKEKSPQETQPVTSPEPVPESAPAIKTLKLENILITDILSLPKGILIAGGIVATGWGLISLVKRSQKKS